MSNIKIPIVKCWCVPRDKLYIMDKNPCLWPKCINGEKNNPNETESKQ